MAVSPAANFFTQGNNQLQKEALELFQSLQNSPDGWKVCIQALNTPQDETRVFFCLLVIESYVKQRYATDSSENQTALKQFVVNWFTSHDQSYSTFILNKFAQVIGSLFLVDFPHGRWITFFQDFMSLCRTDRHRLLFLKILHQINADIADNELNRSQKEVERGTLIKDMMRDHCIVYVAKFWIEILGMYKEISPSVVCTCLEVIGSYVAWIDISLITNDCLMSKLFALFTNDDFRCSVCDCFAGVLHKGMDPLSKTTLIEQFLAVDAIKRKLHAIVTSNNEQDETFLVKLSRLINTIGLELIESFKKIKVKSATEPSLDASLKALANAIEEKFPLLCFFLGHHLHSVCLQVHPFAREYIQWVKANRTSASLKQGKPPLIEPLTEERVKEIISIFGRIIISTCKYNASYNFGTSADESELDECRKSGKIIFENLLGLNANYCTSFVCSELTQPVLSNWSGMNLFDVEISLYMFYLLGENLNSVINFKQVEQLLGMLITSNISNCPFPPVQVLFFEIVTRFEKVYAQVLPNLIPQILVAFVDERGLKNADANSRSKVCHLFNKFIRASLRGKAMGKINEFAEEIIKRLEMFLTLNLSDIQIEQQPNAMAAVGLSEEDQLLLYETVASLIISNAAYLSIKKHMLLKSFLLQPLWTNYDHLYSALVTRLPNGNGGTIHHHNVNGFGNVTDAIVTAICQRMSHCINLVARISKAFSNVHTIQSIEGQALFLDSFNNFAKVLSLESIGSENLVLIQSALRQLLHRLVVCLEEAEILPLLPIAIKNVFLPCSSACFSAKTVQELIPLLSQVVAKFKNSWMFQRDLLPFLEQMVTPLLSSLYTLMNDNELSEDEKQTLQKSYYTFLSVLAINNAIEVLTVLDPTALQSVTSTVVQGSVNSDVATQKMCFSILRKLIECQCGISKVSKGDSINKSIPLQEDSLATVVTNNPMDSAFVDFMYKNIVPACFYALCKPPDGGDLNGLISEVTLCLKAVSTSRGQEELTCFLQNLLPQHFPEFTSGGELVRAIASNDLKQAREGLRVFAGQVKRRQ